MNGFYNSVKEWLDAGMPVNSFICGDCMEGMAAMPDKFADLAIVDPPYELKGWHDKGNNRNRFSAKEGSKKKIWDIQPDKFYFNALGKKSIEQIIWGGNYFDLGRCVAPILWDKLNGEMHFADGELAWTSFKVGTLRIIKIHLSQTEVNNERIHPTQKPKKLYSWLLHNYATPGQLILDTHVGSASSLIACEQMNFPYVGFEIDPDYHAAACKRILQARELLKQQDMFAPEKSEGKSHGEMIELAF